jgi:23S rRNA (adenine2503-C2)-methyltransferase
MQESRIDGTRKYLFELYDGNLIESVFMKYHHGNSVCISSQVGCKMGCRFCASTLNGCVRNLSPSEMLDQIYRISRDTNERVSNVVIMGSGEPMLNYDNVLNFIRLVHEPYCLNLGYRNITISTSGIVPGINKLAQENLPITLSISLHAPNNELRTELMPINKRYPIEEVIKAAVNYANTTKRRITYEYILIDKYNDNMTEAVELCKLLKNQLANVNLIPINPVKERNYNRPSLARIKAFAKYLNDHHLTATIRQEMGTDIQAACGQLRNKHLAK